MIEWMPWLFIILGWTADSPEDRQVIAVEVTIDQAECEELGAKYMGSDELSDTSDGNHFQYLCAPMPDREAFNAAVERWQQSRIPMRPQPE